MQKTLSQVNGCPQRNRSETEWYGGVQTRWCERSENESRKKTASFSSYSIIYVLFPYRLYSTYASSGWLAIDGYAIVYTLGIYKQGLCHGSVASKQLYRRLVDIKA